MKRRVFIGISFPDWAIGEMDAEVARIEDRYRDAARFAPKENWHMTVLFLGEQEDQDIPTICEGMDAALSEIDLPPVAFENISYGPPGKEPRMVWLNADHETSAAFAGIKDAIAAALEERGIWWKEDRRDFHGHVTLARIERQTPETRKPLAEPCEELGMVDGYSVDLFESSLDERGAEYTVLHSF